MLELRREKKWIDRVPNWMKKMGGYCWRHGWWKYPYKYRNGANYQEDKYNWEVGCKKCEKESEAYWKDMWKNYWGGIFN